jgi:hypothetical protein
MTMLVAQLAKQLMLPQVKQEKFLFGKKFLHFKEYVLIQKATD